MAFVARIICCQDDGVVIRLVVHMVEIFLLYLGEDGMHVFKYIIISFVLFVVQFYVYCEYSSVVGCGNPYNANRFIFHFSIRRQDGRPPWQPF